MSDRKKDTNSNEFWDEYASLKQMGYSIDSTHVETVTDKTPYRYEMVQGSDGISRYTKVPNENFNKSIRHLSLQKTDERNPYAVLLPGAVFSLEAISFLPDKFKTLVSKGADKVVGLADKATGGAVKAIGNAGGSVFNPELKYLSVFTISNVLGGVADNMYGGKHYAAKKILLDFKYELDKEIVYIENKREEAYKSQDKSKIEAAEEEYYDRVINLSKKSAKLMNIMEKGKLPYDSGLKGMIDQDGKASYEAVMKDIFTPFRMYYDIDDRTPVLQSKKQYADRVQEYNKLLSRNNSEGRYVENLLMKYEFDTYNDEVLMPNKNKYYNENDTDESRSKVQVMTNSLLGGFGNMNTLYGK